MEKDTGEALHKQKQVSTNSSVDVYIGIPWTTALA